MVLFGIAPIGCSPYALAQNSPDGITCVERINSPIQLFNTRLRSMVDELNTQLRNAKFTYVNVYGIVQNIRTNPSPLGNYFLPRTFGILLGLKFLYIVVVGAHFVGMWSS